MGADAFIGIVVIVVMALIAFFEGRRPCVKCGATPATHPVYARDGEWSPPRCRYYCSTCHPLFRVGDELEHLRAKADFLERKLESLKQTSVIVAAIIVGFFLYLWLND
jgi:hypothetical protein